MSDRVTRADAFLNNALTMIDKHGWQVTGVGGGAGSPPFAYTAGLTALGRPELVIAGLGFENMQAILNTVAAIGPVEDGAVLSDVLGGGLKVRIRAGKPTEALYPGTAYRLYQDRVQLLHQVLWPDNAGLFPGEPGFALADLQPLLDREGLQ
jgi:hypothetical protein